MTRFLALLLAATVSTPLSAQSLVGVWDCEGRDGPSRHIRTVQEFRANGQAYHQANVAMGNKGQRLDATVAVRGKWRLKNDVIIEQFRSARLRALTLDGRNVLNTPRGRRLARDMPRRMFGQDRSTRSRIKFVSADKFMMLGTRLKGPCTRR